MITPALSDTCVLRLKHLCLTCKTLVSVAQNTCVCHGKGLHLSKQGEGGRPERLSSLLPDPAAIRCIQGISARQDAAPRLWQKATAYPRIRGYYECLLRFLRFAGVLVVAKRYMALMNGMNLQR